MPKADRKDSIEVIHKLRKVIVKKLTLLVCLFVINSYASLKITSFNIRNFDKKGEGTDKVELVKILQDLQSDVIAVEEIYNNSSFENLVRKNLPDYKLVLSRCGGGGQQNLGFLYNDQKVELVKSVEDSKISDPEDIMAQYGCGSLRPAMLGFFKDRNSKKEFVAIAVHLKAGSGSKNYAKRWKQYNYITKMIRSLRLANNKDVIVIGDFNTTGYDKRDQDYTKFVQMLSSSGTSTASDQVACTSYWGGKDHNDGIEEPSVLDHIVYTKSFMGMKLRSVSIGTHCQVADCKETYNSVLGRSYEAVSDHCPLSAHFE